MAKILHIAPNISTSFGGPVTSMNHIIQMWLAGGHSVQVLALDQGGQVASVNGKLKLVSTSFPARLGNSRAAAEWLAQSYKQFDLVFIHNIWTALCMRSAIFLRRQHHPYVMIPHGSLEPFDVQKKAILKKLIGPLIVRRCLEGSAAVLCSTQREADGLVTYGSKCRKVVLPWPVSKVYSEFKRQESRKILGIHEDEFVILFLGRIDYKKGFPVLLPAVQRLVRINHKIRLLIVGPDSKGYLAKVHQMVNNLNLRDFVTFIPTVAGQEKLQVFCAADCFTLPSLNENFGNTVVEAMQQGLPCVISNNVYICDEIERGGAGFVCRYDALEVFEALKKLADDSALREQMSAAAERTAKIFAPENLKARYLALLNDVAKV